MGKAKELMLETQEVRAIALSLNLPESDLAGFSHELREDSGRTLIVWRDDAPEGVKAVVEHGELVTEIDLPEYPYEG